LDISTQDACAFWNDHAVYKYPPPASDETNLQEPRCRS
jgi:hypothetical protein